MMKHRPIAGPAREGTQRKVQRAAAAAAAAAAAVASPAAVVLQVALRTATSLLRKTASVALVALVGMMRDTRPAAQLAWAPGAG